MASSEHKESSESCEQQSRDGGESVVRVSSSKPLHLVNLESTAKIFPVGTQMYGRQKEKQSLLDCWEMCRRTNCQEIVVISGSPGAGKSTLADSLRPVVNKERPRVFFLSGKFSEVHHHRKGPFEVFVSAFSGYVNQLLDSGDRELIAKCGADVLRAVKNDKHSLVHMIPAFDQLFRATHDYKQSKRFTQASGLGEKYLGTEMANRLGNTFSNAVAAICSHTPLVLFLDDIQWADIPSLEVMRSLLQFDQSMALLIVTTVRSDPSNTVLKDDAFPLQHDKSNSSLLVFPRFHSVLEEIEQDESIRATFIDLSNLTLANIEMFLADVLEREPADVRQLAEIALLHTQGNIFFLLQFLRLLIEQLIIERIDSKWVWEDSSLRSEVGEKDSILDLVGSSILSLPAPVQETLKIASCLGHEIDASALDRVLQTPVEPLLKQAYNEGLLVFSIQSGGYRFSHDLIRHVVFDLIPEKDIAALNLKIGRRLLRSSSPQAVEENIMMIVSLLNAGADQVVDQRERYKVAELNLRAAKKALLVPSFPDAARYLRKGIQFLGDDCWNLHYELALDLYSYCAEVETANANFEVVAHSINEVVLHGASLNDKIKAYFALLKSMEVQDDLNEATAVCINVLAQLDERFPSRVSKWAVVREFVRTRSLLRGKSDETILALPSMTDLRKKQASEFLSMGFMLGWRSRSPISVLFAFRSVRLSVRYGINAYSALAFALYASTLCGLHINHREGYRFGKVASKISEKYHCPRVASMTNLILGNSVVPWTRPVEHGFQNLMYASQVALDTGYVASSAQARTSINVLMHVTGKKLVLIRKNVKEALKFARLHRQRVSELSNSVILQMVHCYDGTADSPCHLTGTAINFEQSLLKGVESSNKMVVMLLYYFSMELSYVHDDLSEADRMAQCCMKLFHKAPSHSLASTLVEFMNSMIAVALCRAGTRRAQNLRMAKSHFKSLSAYSKDCPDNFLHMKLALEAELESLRSNPKKRETICGLYAEAFQYAKKQENFFLSALIREKWGDYLETQGERQNAFYQWNKSADLYGEWGAVVKCQKLREKVDGEVLSGVLSSNTDKVSGLSPEPCFG